VAVRKSIEHIHVRADALAESAGAGEGSLITDEEGGRRRDYSLK
jgi:hypothetical protein